MENPVVDLKSVEPDANISTQETSEANEAQQKLNSPALTSLLADNESGLQESSSSQESCQTYFTRRKEELGAGDATIPIPEVTVLPEKQRFSGDLEPAPGDNQLTFIEVGTTLYPPVHFLDSDHSFCKDPHKSRETPPVKKPRVIVGTSGLQEHPPSTNPKANYSPAMEDDIFLVEEEQEQTGVEGLSGYTSGTDFSVGFGATSGDQARSTLADALALPAKGGRIALVGVSESDGIESTTAGEPKEPGTRQVSSSSRALVNQYFQHATAYSLPKEHPTITLNSEQMQTILRVVADESARASYAMMEDIVKKASRLTLGQG